MKEISEQFYNSDQSWHYERIVAVNNEHISKQKLRVLIRRNAYSDQSWVRGYVLNPQTKEWNLLVDRPIQTARCKVATYTDETTDKIPFVADGANVIEELIKILS